MGYFSLQKGVISLFDTLTSRNACDNRIMGLHKINSATHDSSLEKLYFHPASADRFFIFIIVIVINFTELVTLVQSLLIYDCMIN